MDAIQRNLGNAKKQCKYTRFLLYVLKKTSIHVYLKLCDYGDIKYEILLPLINNFVLNVFQLCLVNNISLDSIKKLLEQSVDIIIDYICISHDNININYKPKYSNAIAFAYQKITDILGEIRYNTSPFYQTECCKNTATDKIRDKRKSNGKNNGNGNSKGKSNSTSNSKQNTSNNSSLPIFHNSYRPSTPEPFQTFNDSIFDTSIYKLKNSKHFPNPHGSDYNILKNMKLFTRNKSIRSFKKTIELVVTMFNILVAKLFSYNNVAKAGISIYGFKDMNIILESLHKDINYDNDNDHDYNHDYNYNHDYDSVTNTLSDDTEEYSCDISNDMISILAENLERVIDYIWMHYTSISRLCNYNSVAINIGMITSILSKTHNMIPNTDDMLLVMVIWYIYIKSLETMASSLQSSVGSLILSRTIIDRIRDFIIHKFPMRDCIKKHYREQLFSNYLSTNTNSHSHTKKNVPRLSKKNNATVISSEFFHEIYDAYISSIEQNLLSK